MKKRTHIDFSKHVLDIVDNEHVKIHWLHIPGTSQDNIRFINAGGIMAVTGDYGNWIFCRHFLPEPGGRIDAQYATEKLRIASQQDPYEMDSEATKAEIQALIDSGEFTLDNERVYLEELLEKADCRAEEYKAWAYPNAEIDFDLIPYVKDIKYWLKAVYDGFDEVCERLKVEQTVEGA